MSEAQFYDCLLYGWFGLSALVFVILQFLSAPYGRHERDGWGPKIPNLLGWMIMELPAVGTIIVCYLLDDAKINTPALVFLGIWQIHYLNRTFIFPFRTRTHGKQMPLLIALMGGLTNMCIGYLVGRHLTFFGPQRSPDWLSGPMFIIGTLIFVTGFFINNQSDTLLINLRKPGETGYKIPHGGLYRYVSCPNYLGEIIEWVGFAIASSSLAGVVFVVWTMANLVPRAMQNHHWYRLEFENYPPERRRIIPFIF